MIRPGIWRELNNFSSGAVSLVLASELYDEGDYIREYSDFLREKRICINKIIFQIESNQYFFLTTFCSSKIEIMQEQSFSKTTESTAFRVLLALGLSHLLNDTAAVCYYGSLSSVEGEYGIEFCADRIYNTRVSDLRLCFSAFGRVLSG